MKSLKDQLQEKSEASQKTIASDDAQVMKASIEETKTFFDENPPLGIGDKFPDAMLMNIDKEDVDLYKTIDGKTVIINFYRGSWCPFCNLELGAYIHLLNLPENKDVFMIAISPEKPDITVKEMDFSKLPFHVLSDLDNQLAKKLGIAFKLSESLKVVYKKFQIDLEKDQGNVEGVLPVPATYIVDKDLKITQMWFNPDYSKRAEPQEVIDAYRK